jgi:UDP-glucose 4-epimerase
MKKRAIVFGGAGFVGSHAADALAASGYEVIIYDRERSPYLKEGYKMIVGDILDDALVDKSLYGCSVVYNFAGVSDIDTASRNPLETVKANILGNTVILEACRRKKIERFVYASSIYVYSKAGSFYRSSKQACENIIENYNEIFGIPFTIIRYGSLFGPRSDSRNFIYKILKQAVSECKITREGDGEELREYIHVCDAAKCSVDILCGDYLNQHVIISGNQQMKVKDLLAMIREMLDNKIEIEYIKPTYKYHYEITPYTFTPKVAKRVVSASYLDLGQGILKLIQGIYDEANQAAEGGFARD